MCGQHWKCHADCEQCVLVYWGGEEAVVLDASTERVNKHTVDLSAGSGRLGAHALSHSLPLILTFDHGKGGEGSSNGSLEQV